MHEMEQGETDGKEAAAPFQRLFNVCLLITESNYLFCWNFTCSSLLHEDINVVRIPFDTICQVVMTERKVNEILTYTW